jgi:hypothetical protein
MLAGIGRSHEPFHTVSLEERSQHQRSYTHSHARGLDRGIKFRQEKIENVYTNTTGLARTFYPWIAYYHN